MEPNHIIQKIGLYTASLTIRNMTGKKTYAFSATQLNVATFGAIMGIAGIMHGVGEILQGNKAPEGIMILSWPDSAFFRHTSGEPAMTVIPNLFYSGIVTVFVSLLYIIWAVMYLRWKHNGLMLIFLSIIMLLVGGGIFPPIIAFMISIAATKTHTSSTWQRTHFNGNMWPWSFAVCITSWVLLFPGTNILNYYFGFENTIFTVALISLALGSLLLSFLSGFAFDLRNSPKYVRDI